MFFQSSLPYVDVDMIIDATLFLWNRCKPYFQRVVSCNQESCRHILNDKDCDKVISLHFSNAYNFPLAM